ncbi:unnamed protein product [Trypanosoma congolense IL3000]|uniref:WGS project CAEQ00000000 data, annotated contig 872 n=1 Tax=Trypanosoma congolense (strain IL3000) TaxID=1068625 RepID=F9WJ50_TRYCI|nr:unnamed protein product [Trypanosoma congolense IL3000]
MDIFLPPRPTRTVDLNTMSRADLIELAKKQSQNVREKAKRISFLEELVRDLTGQADLSGLGGANAQSAARSLSNSLNSTNFPQGREEERFNFADAMGQKEEVIKMLRQELDQKKKELEACQNNSLFTFTGASVAPDALERAVEERMAQWKEASKVQSAKDRARIEQLEAEVRVLRGNQMTVDSFFTTCDSTAQEQVIRERVEREVQEKVEQWQVRMKTRMDEDQEKIQNLQEKLNAYSEKAAEMLQSKEQIKRLQQEVELLRLQLAEALRDRDAALKTSGPLVASLEESWYDYLKSVSSLLSVCDERKKSLLLSADFVRDSLKKKDELFCNVMQAFRASSSKLEVEVLRVTSECARLQLRVAELEGAGTSSAVQ